MVLPTVIRQGVAPTAIDQDLSSAHLHADRNFRSEQGKELFRAHDLHRHAHGARLSSFVAMYVPIGCKLLAVNLDVLDSGVVALNSFSAELGEGAVLVAEVGKMPQADVEVDTT